MADRCPEVAFWRPSGGALGPGDGPAHERDARFPASTARMTRPALGGVVDSTAEEIY